MTGTAIFLIVLPILYYIPCASDTYCSNGRVEDALFALDQIASNHWVAITWVLFILSIACFNASGVTVTKNSNSIARATLDTCRTVFIWIVSIMIGWE